MKKKAIAVAVLTAALALTAVPAFAASNTTVKVTTSTESISVDVPLTMPLTVPAGGGEATTKPSDYKITNQSAFPIKVSKIETTAKAGWGIALNALTSDSTSTNVIGDLYLKLTPTGKTGVALNSAPVTPAGWSMNGKSDAANSALAFTIDASASQLKKTFDAATDALEIAYTVEADPAYVPPVS